MSCVTAPFVTQYAPYIGMPTPTEALAEIAASHPLGRNGQADEVAGVIAFLAGDRAR